MTGPWKPQYTIALLVAGLLACSISYYTGKNQQAMDDLLKMNKAQTVKQDAVTHIDSARVDTAHKHSDILAVYRGRVRAKVTVRGDSILLPDSVNHGKDSTIAVSPEIAQLIAVDDSTIAAQARTIALQDTLIASLHVGLSLRDERISLLEKQHSPRLGIKSGIAIGAVSTVAVVVVAVKVIQAFHR